MTAGRSKPIIVIYQANDTDLAYPKPLYDSLQSFLVRFEVDDPDEPINNPSIWFAVPFDQDEFFGPPGGIEGMGLCER